MNRKELKSIYFLNRELEMWKEELLELRSQSLVSSPQGNTGGGASGRISDRTGNVSADIADVEELISDILKRIQRERRVIMNHIEQIDDSVLRQIVQYRCVNLMPWNQVAASIGYVTEDSVKKIFYRAYPE